ncbi:hypothetical protein [Streptomyces sp. NPDC006510]|uniref:hypothetical protein n=1 Tax=Streptomyces sp. NPDC006510 TaxID=3155600 RepID=UPI0033A0AE90
MTKTNTAARALRRAPWPLGGLQAVVDKDLASAAPAAELKADMLAMPTDGDFVSEN